MTQGAESPSHDRWLTLFLQANLLFFEAKLKTMSSNITPSPKQESSVVRPKTKRLSSGNRYGDALP